jgi:mannose-6-phosphate isomerase-like protein (cupin superfamily)
MYICAEIEILKEDQNFQHPCMNTTIINPVVKDEVTFVQTAAATSGRITTLQVTLMPGGGTPMHYHRNFSETFVVVSGELTITLKNRTLVLSAGQKLTVEKGVAHRFSNNSESPVVFTTVVLPGSQGFEDALRILYGLAADGKTDDKGIPRSLMVMAVVSKISDMHLAGPGVLLLPLLQLLNLVARVSGYREKLLAQYCKN